ncbi:hypothetical protein I7I53_03864 [Histoplasma capsulatum var. duboisii H88]|uniref:Uncharacterized protein n=1 Tax=Ajellomyces capsulatus (strain H88) TaxID=544711 RepID=A0A8A1LV99_AJEC8|nr:hypothetical protein I7I53_03864 [Histoplasma capsulatum var. duboisii H88]
MKHLRKLALFSLCFSFREFERKAASGIQKEKKYSNRKPTNQYRSVSIITMSITSDWSQQRDVTLMRVKGTINPIKKGLLPFFLSPSPWASGTGSADTSWLAAQCQS